MAHADWQHKVLVTVTDPDTGEVLGQIMVDGDYLKPAAVYPKHMLTQCIQEALDENFDIEVIQ